LCNKTKNSGKEYKTIKKMIKIKFEIGDKIAFVKKHIPVEEETTVTIYMMLIRFKK